MAQKIEPQWLCLTQAAAYFDVATLTISRWQKDPRLDFPKPSLINDRRYWDRDALAAWMRRRSVIRAEKVA